MEESTATAVLQSYYNAMNEHDVDKSISFLSEDVEVTFPEVERNWNGRGNGKVKFEGMFARMPGFTGSFELCEGGVLENETCNQITLTVSCRFICRESGSDSQRNMRYTIDKLHNHIIKIEHL